MINNKKIKKMATKGFTKLAGTKWTVDGEKPSLQTIGEREVLGIEIFIEKSRTISDDGEIRIHMEGGKYFNPKELVPYYGQEGIILEIPNPKRWRYTADYLRFYHTKDYAIFTEVDRSDSPHGVLITLSNGKHINVRWLERIY